MELLTELRDVLAADSLLVASWRDPALEEAGHDPRSRYVERFWLPVLGPSTVFLLRYLADVLDDAPDGRVLGLAETARALGLGERQGKNAPFARTLARAIDFETARLSGGALLVRRHLPSLGRRQIARLPPALRASHERIGAATPFGLTREITLGRPGSAPGVVSLTRRGETARLAAADSRALAL